MFYCAVFPLFISEEVDWGPNPRPAHIDETERQKHLRFINEHPKLARFGGRSTRTITCRFSVLSGGGGT